MATKNDSRNTIYKSSHNNTLQLILLSQQLESNEMIFLPALFVKSIIEAV